MFRKKKEIFHVGNVEIIINESTLDVFRNTVYYVDMQNALCIKGVPFITCDIYEDEFSDHLIAQVGLEDDERLIFSEPLISRPMREWIRKNIGE